MTTRRPWAGAAAVWFVAAWVVATVAMSYAAGGNFVQLVPEKLPRAQDAFGPTITEPEGRLALRYVAGELNRHFFALYAVVQIVFGAGALLFHGLSGRGGKVLWALLGAAFLSALWFQFHLVPEIVEIGRRLDLVPKVPVTPDRETFDGIHRMSVGVEVGKLLVLLAVSGMLIAGDRRGGGDTRNLAN